MTRGLTIALCRHTATLLSNGMVLIVGGNDGNGNALKTAELYDPATGTFTATGMLNNARSGHTATLLNNGMVLIAGGYTGTLPENISTLPAHITVLDTAELYNPATGIFTLIGTLNTPRFNHTATLLSNGRVLFAGGFTDSNLDVTNSAELF